MKKNHLLAIMVTMFMVTASAQDTQQWGEGPYMWSAFGRPDFVDTSHHNPMDGTGHMRQFYADKPMFVCGVAVLAHWPTWVYTSLSEPIMLRLFQQRGGRNDIVMLDSVCITPHMFNESMANAHLLEYDQVRWWNTSDTVHCLDTLFELRFAVPHMVSDTFYMGLSQLNGCTWNSSAGMVVSIYDPIPRTLADCVGSEWFFRDGCYIEEVVLPILCSPGEEDSLQCSTPERPEVLGMDLETGNVTLRWEDDTLATYYKVALGDDTLAPENNRIYTLVNTQANFMGLTQGHSYAAWVRKECRHHCYYHPDTLMLSDWSEPVVFSFGTLPDTSSSGDTTAILLPEEAGEVISVEHYDLLGRRLVLPPARGFYIRRAITTKGVVTRKVVKEQATRL